MKARTLFVAGSTGETGKVLVSLADAVKLAIVPHVRPKRAAEGEADSRAAVLELSDSGALKRALSGCSTVVQLIGTMRKRFKTGDTYETSDIGTTQQLVDAAKSSSVDHFILLSSTGAGRPIGAYLQAKARAEQIVRESGIPFTLFRPSALVGGERKPIPLLKPLTRVLGLTAMEPISLGDLSSAMLLAARDRRPLGAVLEGDTLWEQVDAAKQAWPSLKF
jgi:nucleoside-diphosphate-sugar epimerase